jgi:hypothetical protein
MINILLVECFICNSSIPFKELSSSWIVEEKGEDLQNQTGARVWVIKRFRMQDSQMDSYAWLMGRSKLLGH